ncbi:MAG: sulfur oxidation c-type cytochrome SoxX [Burkholderiales bacterium 35-55-47]|jgi:sulfur-oxidizing protein SoxX|uniref:sulfur oxidation c-type cytochrome SoxX n=1 Tax=Limnohabitans sp. TaxID=1907725 RepID=UPI000BDD51DB|nr:sulfur oxidation c-type cytochrome SoxX [Limnohabitans sp.]OYY19146.1 MAG: sulfur oxidation c-type cytochrome SoxX [Burkholderiales bacterium 35-55-47]OYZ73154.1 MAG: sulfur oxidation c-type cytochrome SoxX [Burkholderiales bacterium 24-55-52]OZB00328.1 MAG: sulfur oxidation c-type cytochrome SoxX [Burkholderiales bacterium 39-55-53]HQR87458.1 sulfur oxidation c-type cytochrome SoxX [Limnohabitans sp.]HQS26750.1 sulfur oxidation c-type cytochrome SoxX [Limnohabitans sp.]
MNRKHTLALTAIAAVLLTACATPMPSSADLDKLAQDIAKRSFRAQGQVKLDVLNQDEDNRLCSEADTNGTPISEANAKAIEARNLKTIKPPSDGKYLGDFKAGEKVAQSGRGLTWTDKEGSENGGNCYNCHQISKTELSYGNLGPSLYNYGKIRGVTDPTNAAAKPIVEYTWGKLNNARAYNACTNMPRFGHKNILTEKQIKDVMALLLDPASPINK